MKRRGSGRDSSPRPPRRLRGWVRSIGWLVLLLSSLFVVTWRQTRGLALEGELRDLETRQALAEAERVELVRRIETLRSRARIVRVARDRLGMHLAVGDEIVFLPAVGGAATGEIVP